VYFLFTRTGRLLAGRSQDAAHCISARYLLQSAVQLVRLAVQLTLIGGKNISLIGVSVAGGVAHNIGQLLAASMVFASLKIFYYLPMLLIAGVITGVAVGFAVRYLVTSLSKISLFEEFLDDPGDAAKG
jgi:heptaprenyl diphosphate synthase